MQILTNEKKVARGARLGKVGTLIGLGFLTAGLVISLLLKEMPLMWISFVCLLLGLLFSSIGTMNMNRWVKEPRSDQALAQGLKGFDDRYRLYNYYLPAPHVLLCPGGLFVLTTMGQDGVIRYDGVKFHRNFSPGRLLRFMADEGLGRPLAEVQAQTTSLQQFLDAHEAGEGIEIQNVLVFHSPRAELEVEEAPLPIVTTKGLKKALRRQPGEKLPASSYEELQTLFDSAAEVAT